MKLSLIDLSPVPYNGTRINAYQNTIDTAQHIEQLGYHRIWLAEHHNSLQLAGRAPEVLIPTIASKTSKIRVGSGSVLLNHYSPSTAPRKTGFFTLSVHWKSRSIS